MSIKAYRYLLSLKSKRGSQGFSQFELLGIILIAGVLPSLFTSVLAHKYDFHSILHPGHQKSAQSVGYTTPVKDVTQLNSNTRKISQR